jgi:hypothetical protein
VELLKRAVCFSLTVGSLCGQLVTGKLTCIPSNPADRRQRDVQPATIGQELDTACPLERRRDGAEPHVLGVDPDSRCWVASSRLSSRVKVVSPSVVLREFVVFEWGFDVIAVAK